MENLAQLQMIEQGLNNLIMQKQLFQIELTEANSALEEINKPQSEDFFKILGSLMVKADKIELKKELERKKEILNLRLKAIETQENEMKENLIKTRDSVLKGLKNKK